MHFSTKVLQITLRCIHLISGRAAPSHHCHQISGVNNPAGEADSCKVVISLRNPWALGAYQLMLRRAFLTVGLPRRITLDHGTVFYDNTFPSPFPTRLHLWLLALGIDVCFTRKRCPTDHAKIERTHQTMTLQALLGQQWPHHSALWAGLDARRTMLNRHIPSGVFQGQAPLQAYPQALHSGHFYRPE